MFTLKEEETFKWPVKPKVPVGVGKYETVQFTAVFNVLSSEEIEAISPDPRKDDDEKTVTNFLRRILSSFEDETFPVDAEGDEERNELLISKPYMQRPLIDSFNKGLSGYKAKN